MSTDVVSFKVMKPGRVPIKSWVPELEEQAMAQPVNLSNLPFAIRHVALMPDAHAGYGMPIGGVLFADRAVVPYAIGVDIGCGVALAETDLTVDTFTRDELDRTLAEIYSRVPVGMTSQPLPVEPEGCPGRDRPGRPRLDRADVVRARREPARDAGLGEPLPRDPARRGEPHLRDAALGLAQPGQDDLRRVPQACSPREHAVAFAAAPPGAGLPAHGHRRPSRLLGGDGVRAAVRRGEPLADARRCRAGVRHAYPHRPLRAADDLHHNYAAWESHFGQNSIVHRKGAVRARAGETVLIPGSMGTASYVAEGLGNRESFETCQHGAGRAMSRTAARKAISSEQLFDEMARLGVMLHSGDPKTAAEEAPFAYKDIEMVMAASADLIRPTKRLTPLGVVKG